MVAASCADAEDADRPRRAAKEFRRLVGMGAAALAVAPVVVMVGAVVLTCEPLV